MAKYKIEVRGYGLEIVYAKISKKIYSYWKSKNINDLSPEIEQADEHPAEMVFIEGYDWSSKDDLGHFEGPSFSFESEIIVYDEGSGKKVWRSNLGEMNLPDEIQESIDSDEFFIDENVHKFIFSGIRSLSGIFYCNSFEAKKFELKKLGLKTIDVMGHVLLIGITYDDIDIEIGVNDLLQGDLDLSIAAL